MNVPQLLLRPSRDKRAYRLKARFKIEAYPRHERMEREHVLDGGDGPFIELWEADWRALIRLARFGASALTPTEETGR